VRFAPQLASTLVRRASFAAAIAFVAACGGTPTPAASVPLATAGAPAPTAPATSAATPTTAATAPYLRIALTDVRTSERFTLGGFTGKTVIVEGMAVW
jgi:hypothetical protein